jgi:hypothetical protein
MRVITTMRPARASAGRAVQRSRRDRYGPPLSDADVQKLVPTWMLSR